MTPAQKATVKAWLDANAADKSDDAAAALLNADVSPAYWAWKSSVPVTDAYNLQDDVAAGVGGYFNWPNYIAQTAIQQDGWKQMSVTGQLMMAQLNVRQGINAIFGGLAPGNAQRDHILAIGRRTINVFEQLFVVAVSGGSVATGNDGIAGNRGKKTNPDLLVLEGTISAQNVSDIRAGL